jgi:RHS repeat-associated protein
MARRSRAHTSHLGTSFRPQLLHLEDRLLPGSVFTGLIQGFFPTETMPAWTAPTLEPAPAPGDLETWTAANTRPEPSGSDDTAPPAVTTTPDSARSDLRPATTQPAGLSSPVFTSTGMEDPFADPLSDSGSATANAVRHRTEPLEAAALTPAIRGDVASTSTGPTGSGERPGSAPLPGRAASIDPILLSGLSLSGDNGGSGTPLLPGGNPPPVLVADANNGCSSGCTPGGPLTTAQGADGGNPASLMFSSAGIRYFDGAIKLNTSDLASNGFGTPWGQTRSWASNPAYAPPTISPNGHGWIDTQLPFLIPVNGPPRSIALVTSGTDARYFDLNGSVYTPRFFYQEQLRPMGNQFLLTDTTGNQFTFYDFSNPPTLQGKLQSIRDAYGNPTILQWDPGTGHLMLVQRSDPSGAAEQYRYTYLPPGDPNGLLQSVQMVHQGQIVRQVSYTWYTGSPFGNPGDLATVTTRDPNGAPIDTSYYRYQPGQPSRLQFVFGPQSYARLVTALGDPTNLSNDQVAPFADDSYQYDAQGRVIRVVAQGTGCSTCTGGQGTFTYGYLASNNLPGFNNWAMQTTETLPDGNLNIVFTNASGQVLLTDFHDINSNQDWDTWYHYDAQGRLVLTANPSAVLGYNPALPTLIDAHSLAPSSGLLQLRDYYTTTTGTETAPGAAAGYLMDQQIQRGQASTPILEQSQQYFTHQAGGASVHPLGLTRVYRNADGTGAETTSYNDVWYPGTARLQTQTVTLPIISTSQHGSGTSEVTTSQFDPYGRMTVQTDPDGFQTTYQYDVLTGGMTQIVRDPGGAGHLNQIARMTLDGLGRTTARTDPNGNITYTVYNDPNHEVRTYPGWQGTAPTGPTQVTREDRQHNPSYTETLTMAAPPHLSGGQPDGTEPISQVRTLTRTFTSPGGQTIYQDAYVDLTGFLYSTMPTLGVQGVNYYRTLYDQDSRGRLKRTQSPTGTVNLTTYDGLGRVVTRSVGTSDTNAVVVSQNIYDNGGVGDGNLTQAIQFPGGTDAPRVTFNVYDWRDRLVASKAGVQTSEDSTTHRPITWTVYDNRNQVILQDRYDGDGVDMNLFLDANGIPQTQYQSLRRARTTTEYDDQGRVFSTHTFSVNQTNGAVSSTSLTTDAWYDHRGNQIATAAPGGLVTKTHYDAAGRVDRSWSTDGAGGTSWAAANSVANDHVLSQTETTYDNNGNAILVVQRDRFHDETATGSLATPTSAPHARVSYVASWYDPANRLTATVNVGTNGGNPYTRPATPPVPSDTALVTSYVYNDSGWVQDTVDPRGIDQQTVYDMLGRTTTTIANSTGTPQTSTSYTYDGAGHVLSVTAQNDSGPELTRYVYGVTIANGSAVNSNDLLAQVIYPPNGLPNTQSYTRNALGQPSSKTDRNGTTHTYSYDVLGRLVRDSVTTRGPGVDARVLRQETAYDTGGRAYLYTSYDDPNAGNVVSQVEQLYNGLGQLITEYQSHSGPVVPGSTPAVQYTWGEMAGGANHSRLVSMTYPNGRVLHQGYNAGLDDAISRLSFLADDNGSGGIGTHLEEYSYLGLSTVLERAHPEAGVDLTYIQQPSDPFANSDGGDQYTGLDRFGRVIDQLWIREADGSVTDRFQYTYDRDGNRLSQANLVTEALGLSFDEQYQYDALNRLTNTTRGSHTQVWTLDSLGNWTTLTTDGTTQTRDHNAQNQIVDVNGNPLSYDNNGNTLTDENGQAYVSDAWNRIVQVTVPSTGNIVTYSYDALGRRIQENENDAFGQPVTRDLYDSAQWQVVEERETGPTGNTLVRAQNVWSAAYVDALVLRDRDPVPTGSGSLSERLYVQQDANWNVTALVDTTATVQERYVYDRYGQATVLDGNWNPLTGSQFGWVYLHQGGRLDSNTGIYLFRQRDYSPTLGRWLEQDSLGYVDGMNLYEYERSNPVVWQDPSGGFCCSAGYPPGRPSGPNDWTFTLCTASCWNGSYCLKQETWGAQFVEKSEATGRNLYTWVKIGEYTEGCWGDVSGTPDYGRPGINQIRQSASVPKIESRQQLLLRIPTWSAPAINTRTDGSARPTFPGAATATLWIGSIGYGYLPAVRSWARGVSRAGSGGLDGRNDI